MGDFLDILAKDAERTVDEGYYNTVTRYASSRVSLREAILKCTHAPVITEIKAASPSAGTIKTDFSTQKIAEAMQQGGAVGISVLTEPKHFKGSLKTFNEARKTVKLPILMKDIIISPIQIEAATKIGADVVLLIQALFDRGDCEFSVGEMIARAHEKKLEVLLETHNEKELCSAINSDADLVGINNRNLATLEVDLNTTKNLLEKNAINGKIIVSESGVKAPADVRFLHGCGAKAFLVGSAIMLEDDVKRKVKELVDSL